MIQIIFKNLEKSELAREAATERIETMIHKFPILKESRISVTLEMENSPLQAGPDLFKVKVQVSGGRYRGIRIVKSSSNLYVALAGVVELMLENLNTHGDKLRVKERSMARKYLNKLSNAMEAI
jgi:ribosome-associated translation inhibitor RaiA